MTPEYQKLTDYLLKLDLNEILLTIKEIDEIIEDPLPWMASCRPHKFWWNNDKNNYYHIWKDAGFTAHVYPKNLTVRFTKKIPDSK